ncbi:MAG: hypothetical protein ACE14L_05630 [Terriglobales bacterium]
MKRALFLVLALSVGVFAQAPKTDKSAALPATPPAYTTMLTEPAQPVTHSDLYCAGFVTPERLPRANFVAGGLQTPVQSRFNDREFLYLHGSGFTPGTRVSIVRELHDPNRYESFPGEKARLARAGTVYGDIGYAVVIKSGGPDTFIAQVEFSCEDILAGDLVVPFAERQPVSYRQHSTVDLFPSNETSLSGRIIAARDFDKYLGTNRKVYLDIGAQSGVKPGDYFRIVRGYRTKDLDATDAASYGQTIQEDTQKNAPALSAKQRENLPRHVVGEVVVLSARPTTATAMITFALEDVHIGDVVQLEK